MFVNFSHSLVTFLNENQTADSNMEFDFIAMLCYSAEEWKRSSIFTCGIVGLKHWKDT